MKTRTERDSLGTVEVPIDRYYGAQTQRSPNNFKIGQERFPREFIRAYEILKKAVAIINHSNNKLDGKIFSSICQAADEVIDGKRS